MTIDVLFENGCVVVDDEENFVNIGAGPVLKELQENGNCITISTERKDVKYINKIRKWCDEYGIYILNMNTTTRYINLYINPKDISAHITKTGYINWNTIIELLRVKGIISIEQENVLKEKIRKELYYA